MTTKTLLTITALFLLVRVYASAQVDDYPILRGSEYVDVQVNKKAVLYPNTRLKSFIEDGRRDNIFARQPVYLSSVRTEKVQNSIKVTIVGFAREEKSTPYTLYIVRCQNQYYYLRPEDCLDNSYIEEWNRQLEEGYKSLIERRDALEDELETALSDKRAKLDEEKKQLKAKENRLESSVDAEMSERKLQDELEYAKQFDTWVNTLSPSAQKAARIISITNSLLTAPNSAGGCSYGFNFINNSKSKTVKYLTWRGVVVNAVNDRVSCEITGNGVFSGRITGPIPPDTEGAGVWENLLYNPSARDVRLTGISITYTDDSSASIAGGDAQAIMNAPRKKSEMDSFLERIEAQSEQQNSITNEETVISRRLRFVEDPFREYRFTTEKVFFSHEISLINDIMALNKEISEYERNNYIPADRSTQNILAY